MSTGPSDQHAYHGEIDQFISEKYHVIAPISKGGTSEIYKAVDNTSNSMVAIKILPSPHFSGIHDQDEYEESVGKTLDIGHRIIDRSGEYIIQEANFLTNCLHPNIIRLRDYNLKGQRPYIVLDFKGNITLKNQILNNGKRFSIKETLKILTHLCSALGYIHKKGFVYCDVKPSNVMSNRQKITLIDFGLVCPIGMRVTGGTIGYMAPEILQVNSDQIKASPTLDIYALGIVLYELLTGFHPLASQKIYSSRGNYFFDRPSITDKNSNPAAASELNPLLSKDFDDVLLRCVNKNPKDRYQNMDALLKDFEKEAVKLI
jgi:serine/threonine-protein kinase